MSYATLAQFKAWVTVEDSLDDGQIQTVLDAATRSIDRSCGRHFTLETGVTKLYYTNDPYRLDVVDLISAASIKVDINANRTYQLTLGANDYELQPYVDEAGLVPARFQSVHIWPYSSHLFQPGRLVQVIGDFGYVDTGNVTPADVMQACLILASRLWKRRETPFGVLSVPDMGTAVQIRKTDPDVASLLEPYVRENAWVAV